MHRTFLLKSPIFRQLTWSRCTYYLRNLPYRKMSNCTDSEFDPGGLENKKLQSQEEQTVSHHRIMTDSSQSNRPLKAPVSRMMDRNPESLYKRYLMTPDQPENPRLLKVGIIGAPNAGKSTLINTLMGWKVNGVSKKVHTTRKNTNTVLIMDNAQIIFIDTPGMITPAEKRKHKCDGSILSDPEKSLQEADAVGVIVDVENKWTRGSLHREVLKILHLHKDVHAFLILNKIDSLRSKSFGKQENILLGATNKLCDGIIGGSEFGRSRERVIKKKKGNLMDKLDHLEKKYGKLETRRKEVVEEKNSETSVDEEHCADSNVRDKGHASLRKNDITGSSLEKETDYMEHVQNESGKSKMIDSAETRSNVLDESNLLNAKGPDMVGDIFTPNDRGAEEEKYNNNKYSNANKSENLKAVSFENSESQNADIDFDSNSELLRNSNEVSKNEKTNVCETFNEMSENYNFEKSYQSEFLAHILSAPALPDYAFPDQPVKEVPKKVSKMKEAAEAVKGKLGWSGFEQVFLVSALDGTGIDYLKEYLYKISRPADWIYHSSVITDQHPHDIAKMCVTQSLLDNLPSYLPYVVDPEIIYWDIDSQNYLNVSVEIKLDNAYEMGLVFKGRGGERMQAISSSARQALMDAFQCEVRFKLSFVKKKRK